MIFNLTQGGGGYKLVTPPTVTIPAGGYTYNGSAQGPTIVYAADTESKIETTNATKTAAGTYTLTFTLKATNKYVWSDGTTAPKTYEYTIAKQTLSVPSVTNTSKTYNGSSQGPTIGSYDSGLISVANSGSNVTSATDAGTYYVVFSLVDSDNYKWATGAVTTIEWTIAKASCGLSLSSNAVTLDKTSSTATVTVTRSGSGAITASSDATSLVPTPSVSGTTVTITGTGTSGSATVTITVAETSNYLGGSATVTVTCDFLKIVTWADGTDEEIAAMLEAHYAGSIDIHEHWAVGDTRSVSLSAMPATGVGESHVAQTVEMVLMNAGGKTLATAINGISTCAFIVGQKNFLSNGTSGEYGYMNSSNTNSGGWESSARRTWCNSVYKNAIPSTLRGIFKEHINRTANGSGSTYTDSTDTFALPAEKEIFGSNTYGNSTAESALTQFKYYETSANRIKKAGASGSAGYWWERSPRSGASNRFCVVGSGGSAVANIASDTYGIAPFGCI